MTTHNKTDNVDFGELQKSGNTVNQNRSQAMTQTAKIQVKEIVIIRAEGLSSECGKKHTVTSYDEAEKVLSRMSHTAPKSGGYDKTDFVVTFADGETYSGRYDLKYTREESLGEHMRSFLTWYAGETKNPHCGQAQYEAFLARQAPEEIAEAKLFLATYEI